MSDRRIRLTAGSVSAEARLNDSRSASAIWDALPLEATAQTWVFTKVRAGTTIRLERWSA